MSSSKSLGINMINLYSSMLDEEFAPLEAVLSARTQELQPFVKVQIKKELGVYDLMMKKAVLEAKLKELTEQITDLCGKGWNTRTSSYSSIVAERVTTRINEMNAPMLEILAKKKEMKNDIRLCGATKEVADVFRDLKVALPGLLAQAKALPPVNKTLGLANGAFEEIKSLVEKDKEEND